MIGAHITLFLFFIFYFFFYVINQQGPAQGQKTCVRTMSSFKQKYIIRKQRQTIRNILNHIKHPTRKISNHNLKEYLYHLGAIIDITADGKTARAAEKVTELTRRYLKYRVRKQPSRFTIR